MSMDENSSGLEEIKQEVMSLKKRVRELEKKIISKPVKKNGTGAREFI